MNSMTLAVANLLAPPPPEPSDEGARLCSVCLEMVPRDGYTYRKDGHRSTSQCKNCKNVEQNLRRKRGCGRLGRPVAGSVSEASKKAGVAESTVRNRIKTGMTLEEALAKPKEKAK